MENKTEKKKVADRMTGAWQATVDFSKKAASAAQEKAAEWKQQAAVNAHERRMKKYNPLFSEQWNSPDFHLPNLIVIVDDAVRRGIDVCEGAIGWLETRNGVEVLCLYDEAVEQSGLQFVPTVNCDAAYYVDNFERKKFIRTDCIFSKAFEEKIAELKHIANMLGAKYCSITIEESSLTSDSQKRKIDVAENDNTVQTEQDSIQKGNRKGQGRITATFDGSDIPRRPNLKWYAYDDTIKELVESRCGGENRLRQEELILKGSSSATISCKTARMIDGVFGDNKRIRGQTSFEIRAVHEQESETHFYIEF